MEMVKKKEYFILLEEREIHCWCFFAHVIQGMLGQYGACALHHINSVMFPSSKRLIEH